jgi:hypothetical protein
VELVALDLRQVNRRFFFFADAAQHKFVNR